MAVRTAEAALKARRCETIKSVPMVSCSNNSWQSTRALSLAKYEDRAPELSVSIMVWRPSDDYAVATSASVRDTGLLSGIVALDGNKVTQGPLVATHHLSGSDESKPFKAWIEGTTQTADFRIGLRAETDASWTWENPVTFTLQPSRPDLQYWTITSQDAQPIFSGTSIPVEWWVTGPESTIGGTVEIPFRGGEQWPWYTLPTNYSYRQLTESAWGYYEFPDALIVHDGLVDGAPLRVGLNAHVFYTIVPEPSAISLLIIGVITAAANRRRRLRKQLQRSQ